MEIDFILVETGVPANIGAAARAIKTMGFSNLVLVSPCEYLEGEATWLAHGSGDILTSARTFASLSEAAGEYDMMIATTARKRWLQQDTLSSRQLGNYLSERASIVKRVAVVFGREESGLTNREMELCDIAVCIPLATVYPSLNLSQAVMVIAYELSSMPGRQQSSEPSLTEPNESLYREARRMVEEVTGMTEIAGNSNLRGRIMERLPHASEGDIKLILSLANALHKEIKKREK